MNRRSFLRHSGIAGAGFVFLPGLLTSCKKQDLFADGAYSGNVAVIGAGISGLYAAMLLEQQNVAYEVFEASERIGGRIRKDNSLAGFPIDLGADVFRGDASACYDLLLNTGLTLRSNDLQDYYFFNGNLKSQSEAEENTFFNIMMQSLDSFESYTGADIDAYTYGLFQEVSTNVMPVYNALLANRRGSNLDRLGVYGLRSEAESWSAGQGRFELKDKSLYDFVEQTFSSVIPKVRLNTPLVSIDYSSNKIQLTDSNGNVHLFDKVILTVPLSVLKNGAIAFQPALPASYQTAMSKIAMDRGLVIAIRFSERIWPDNAASIFGPGYIPEYKAVSNGRTQDAFVLTGRVCGEQAEALAALGEGILPAVLDELDEILGNASGTYLSHVIQDWGAENFIQGAFSYDPPGSTGARKILAQPLSNKIYMAGEATHTGAHHGTIHGAMETALRAVMEILESAG